MKAEKVTCTIVTETLSPDSIFALVVEANNLMTHENPQGRIVKDDGDSIEWSTKTKNVEF